MERPERYQEQLPDGRILPISRAQARTFGRDRQELGSQMGQLRRNEELAILLTTIRQHAVGMDPTLRRQIHMSMYRISISALHHYSPQPSPIPQGYGTNPREQRADRVTAHLLLSGFLPELHTRGLMRTTPRDPDRDFHHAVHSRAQRRY
ncbi:hypothetical protein WJX84_011238 [Apatococcus fuscideae]|uniref:Uncharacterized protein n=1 Tax=Apatococcus fuscideae TaxID=2026836 RepID=A0AAW1SWD4_9CHLO